MTSRWPHTSAFVLQFPADADPEAGAFTGRVEHVASGQAAHFRTLEELRIFVGQVLTESRADDAAGTRDASPGSAGPVPADSGKCGWTS